MKKLQKFILFFLILVITLPGESARVITFVPEFIQHYVHHNNEHHKVSFIDFIGEHFSDQQDSSEHEHHENDQENCPLTHNHPIVQLIYIFKKDAAIVVPTFAVNLSTKKTTLPIYQFSFSEYNGSIWQPPKIA